MNDQLQKHNLRKKDFIFSRIETRRYGHTTFTWVKISVKGQEFTGFDPYPGRFDTEIKNLYIEQVLNRLEVIGG